MPADPATLDALKACCGELPTSEFRGDTRVVVRKDKLLEAMRLLKEQRGFDLLVDVTCVDYLNYRDATDRFGLVYLLANTATNERLTVRVYLERAGFDRAFDGAAVGGRELAGARSVRHVRHPLRRPSRPAAHPDAREFAAFPLRKDYPLQGRGERHNFQRITRAEA